MEQDEWVSLVELLNYMLSGTLTVYIDIVWWSDGSLESRASRFWTMFSNQFGWPLKFGPWAQQSSVYKLFFIKMLFRSPFRPFYGFRGPKHPPLNPEKLDDPKYGLWGINLKDFRSHEDIQRNFWGKIIFGPFVVFFRNKLDCKLTKSSNLGPEWPKIIFFTKIPLDIT